MTHNQEDDFFLNHIFDGEIAAKLFCVIAEKKFLRYLLKSSPLTQRYIVTSVKKFGICFVQQGKYGLADRTSFK